MIVQVTKDHAHAANGFEDKLDAAWLSGERFDCTRKYNGLGSILEGGTGPCQTT